MIDSAGKPSKSNDLDKSSKYDYFYDGLTQQDAFGGLLLSLSILNKFEALCFIQL